MSIIQSNRFLWILQALLALLFVFAGMAKLMMDPVELAAQSHMSATFLHFISVCELLGAIGLIVPQLTGIAPQLTPLAAAGLIVIMVGATVLTVQQQPLVSALLPLMTGVLLAIVLYGRLRPRVRA